MKLITTKRRLRFIAEYGRIEEITFYLFGVKFWTENHIAPIEDDEQVRRNFDLEEMTGYEDWRRRMNLMRLTDEQFNRISK